MDALVNNIIKLLPFIIGMLLFFIPSIIIQRKTEDTAYRMAQPYFKTKNSNNADDVNQKIREEYLSKLGNLLLWRDIIISTVTVFFALYIAAVGRTESQNRNLAGAAKIVVYILVPIIVLSGPLLPKFLKVPTYRLKKWYYIAFIFYAIILYTVTEFFIYFQ